MIINKTIGYVLLAVGLLIIIFALLQSYNIFTGKASGPEIFKLTEQKTSQQNNSDFQKQIQDAISKQVSNALPPEFITKFLNLAVWGILAMILVFGGGKISNIGINLLTKDKI